MLWNKQQVLNISTTTTAFFLITAIAAICQILEWFRSTSFSNMDIVLSSLYLVNSVIENFDKTYPAFLPPTAGILN